MVISSEVVLKQIVVHHFADGSLRTSDTPAFTSQPGSPEYLKKLFFKPFLAEERFAFSTEAIGQVFQLSEQLFNEPDELVNISQEIAKHLHTTISSDDLKDGEFIATYFEDCVLDDEVTDVIGIFKIDNKEDFLRVDGQQLMIDQGISQNKIEKGVLIFNTDAESGFQCMVVDKRSKNSNDSWWKERFLQIEKIKDNYFQTQHLIQNLQEFAQGTFEENETAEKISMINESIDYIKKNDFFDQEAYSKDVLKSTDLIDKFEQFSQEKIEENPDQDLSHFEVSKPAIKKSHRYIRSVIKLDKNFHVYVHGNRENITKGFDPDKKKHFYTLYFEEEN